MPSIKKQLEQSKKELDDLLTYPTEKLVDIIKEIGFECDRCTRCCTHEFNDHVFLLDRDVEIIRGIDPSALVPAPYFEFCDQKGRLYVSGYALATDKKGGCVFLKNGLCRIYGDRPTICRVYPYMLHREEDEEGNIEWRQLSGLNQHGCYHTGITIEECERIAQQVTDYEKEYLEHKIRFLNMMDTYFRSSKLRHVQRIYDQQMRRVSGGEEIEVFVFHNNELHQHVLNRET
ncbi:MAG: YkgJ family cysteine cluster protein [Methanosarcinaceae archaeon]|nr:YkgJ family cysteine cluster protein [Methanosarcinaceae archaeon]